MYEIYLRDFDGNETLVAQVRGTEIAYAVFEKTCEIAEMIGNECCLVNDMGEIIAEMGE